VLLEWWGGARGPLLDGGQGNADWLGVTLAITLPLALALAHRARHNRFAVAAAALHLPGLLLARSRTAWLATAIAALVALLVARRRAAAAALAGALSIAVAASLHGATTRALDGRLWIWRHAATVALASPAGAGLGRFSHAFLAAQGDALAALPPAEAARRFVNATTAHGDWLQAAAESGVVALALLLVAVAVALRAAIARRSIAHAAALAAFAVCAIGDSPLRQPAATLIVVLLLGAGGEPRAAPSVAWPLLRVTALGLCTPLFALAVGGWLAARDLAGARDADPITRLRLLDRGARLDPRAADLALEQGLAHLAVGDEAGAAAAIERSRALGASVGSELVLGNLALLRGDPGAAVDADRRALRLDPGSLRAHVALGDALDRIGQREAAAIELDRARALWPHHRAVEALAERLAPVGE
jgi:tetratricopeptide (TPR) repeat protein